MAHAQTQPFTNEERPSWALISFTRAGMEVSGSKRVSGDTVLVTGLHRCHQCHHERSLGTLSWSQGLQMPPCSPSIAKHRNIPSWAESKILSTKPSLGTFPRLSTPLVHLSPLLCDLGTGNPCALALRNPYFPTPK